MNTTVDIKSVKLVDIGITMLSGSKPFLTEKDEI